VERVTLDSLARAWSGFKAAESGRAVDPGPWLDAARRSVGTDSVGFARCGQCGLEMSSPRRPWSQGLFPEDEPYPVRWEFSRCLDDLGHEPLRILEIGCGAGEFLSAAMACGHTAIGLDFNPEAVRRASEHGLTVICGGVDRLRQLLEGGDDVRFDAVVAFHVIEHLAEPERLLAELTPLIRPGGRLIISCPGPRRFTRLIREQQVGTRDLWDYPPHHVLRWTLPALEQFLSAHGWQVTTALEEPLRWIAASAQIGCTRAMLRGYLHRPLRRRISIAWARLQLLALGRTLRGLSIYIVARQGARSAA
jgi:SAM-dependent methyltransferase